YLGDVYERGTADQFERNVEAPYRALLPRMAPTPGNHDWPEHRAGYDPVWQATAGAPTPPWYAFQLGGWRLLSINSETPN
ncbi:hypothetical protein, partial [Staphylococcus aureus]|uniref:hypothetical protein n=1 Tax=Staphylococcus aureus TaxID=1280 RepID=UPI001E43275D